MPVIPFIYLVEENRLSLHFLRIEFVFRYGQRFPYSAGRLTPLWGKLTHVQ